MMAHRPPLASGGHAAFDEGLRSAASIARGTTKEATQ